MENFDIRFTGSLFYEPVYKEMLKCLAEYDDDSKPGITFKYESDARYLDKFSRIFEIKKLDSGDEIETVKNAVRWVYHTLSNSRNSMRPYGNSIDIINNVQQENSGANCFSCAVV